MMKAFREQVTVGAGGAIEIRNPALPEGASAEIIVMIEPPKPQAPLAPLTSYLGKAKGVFATAEEADRFLSGERDAWER